MPSRSHARITGDRRVMTLLRQMADRTRSVEPAWPRVGDVFAENMAMQFDTEGAHLGGRPWAPLSPKYLAWKVKRGLDPRRLHATRQMMLSLTSRPMAVEQYFGNRAVFGTDDEKAHWHQNGTSMMPRRQIIRVTDDLADDVNSVLARYIFEERLTP